MPTTSEKCHCENLWNAEFVCLIEAILFFLQILMALLWWLCSALWCMTTWMSVKQRHSKCSKWPLSAWTHASSPFRHWPIATSITLCWNSASLKKLLPQQIGTRYTCSCITALCPRCGNLQDLDRSGLSALSGVLFWWDNASNQKCVLLVVVLLKITV